MNSVLAAATSSSIARGTTVLVPVGSIEQHGPHLPLDTDTVIAQAVATRAAEHFAAKGYDVVVAPALSYGSSGEHQDFNGTSSIGSKVLRDVLIELTRSMRHWAEDVVFINAHGGNVAAVRSAVGDMRAEGHAVSWIPCAVRGSDLHAGRTETSLMLHLAPWNVRLDRAEIGNTGSLDELLPQLRTSGVKAASANGVLGDPSGATAEEGAAALDAMVHETVRTVRMVMSGDDPRAGAP